MFALRRINQMEREMCSYVEWQFNIEPEALKELEAKCLVEHAPELSQVFVAVAPEPKPMLVETSTAYPCPPMSSDTAPHAIEQDSIIVVLPPPLQKVAGKSLSRSNSYKSIGAATKPSKRAPSAEWLSAAAKKASSTRVQDGYVHATSCVW
ncbi:hypothetical protein FOMPIDRAFT_1055465 [Fomitopsis schrenkii]|uniref:Uncharacterized protein n=1 Tax=Fomitopsis schrenkii TaxID=2126942 RepID=S8DMV0_FOMSC|nr:hypothetical protein FOMPIDRAFT_1055465 [Fomitopsis schrenkii]